MSLTNFQVGQILYVGQLMTIQIFRVVPPVPPSTRSLTEIKQISGTPSSRILIGEVLAVNEFDYDIKYDNNGTEETWKLAKDQQYPEYIIVETPAPAPAPSSGGGGGGGGGGYVPPVEIPTPAPVPEPTKKQPNYLIIFALVAIVLLIMYLIFF